MKKVLANIKRERQHANVHNLETEHLVFVREDGSAITGDMMNKAQLKAFDRADVKDFHFHDTRHTIKTSWARRGIPVGDVRCRSQNRCDASSLGASSGV